MIVTATSSEHFRTTEIFCSVFEKGKIRYSLDLFNFYELYRILIKCILSGFFVFLQHAYKYIYVCVYACVHVRVCVCM